MPDKPMEDRLAAAGEIDRVIHEPARLQLCMVLFVVKRADFLFLEAHTGLTRGNLSSHLSKLESAGYVEIIKEFVDKIPRTLVKLTDAGRKAFEQYRALMLGLLE